MLLQMKSSELGELYALLHMYQNVYGGVEGKLLAVTVKTSSLFRQSQIPEALAENAEMFRKRQRRYGSYVNLVRPFAQ